MSANHPYREEGVVLTGIAEVVRAAKEELGDWPELPEPSFSPIPPDPPERSNLPERVMWTMVGLIGAVTTYGITTGDREILMTVLAIAAAALLRFAGLVPRKRPEEKADDPRTKGPPK